ncbi:hypothetical protein Dsin_020910 [Dipteronia sinensis]|uniref:Uncharacterized protein n=1 Tax=Dipteronia sinensis TaxID=43782 RepID=A0AAE0E5E5_9ROSI|nr:hypothetical protein Dsin_020910 [Dipteronia sinensis]
MGTIYIPSAKKTDWKRNPVSSAMGVGEGEVNNVNMVAAQRNPTNLPVPIQHLAPQTVANRFPASQTSTTSDGSRNFATVT